MTTALDFVTAHVASEASKVCSAASNAIKMGFSNKSHIRDRTVLDRLQHSFSELMGAMELLNAELERNGLTVIDLANDEQIDKAIDSILKLSEYSNRDQVLKEPLRDFRVAKPN